MSARRLLVMLGLCLCRVAPAAPAATEMAVGALPVEIQRALGPPSQGQTFVSAALTRCDLDHDGHEEWLVAASPRDAAGFAQTSRPTWLFVRDGAGWRRAGYLGALVRAEVVPGRARDGIRAVSRDGARARCVLYRWRRERLEATACPAAPAR